MGLRMRCDSCHRLTTVTSYTDLFGEPLQICPDCTTEHDPDELIVPDTETLDLFDEEVLRGTQTAAAQ